MVFSGEGVIWYNKVGIHPFILRFQTKQDWMVSDCSDGYLKICHKAQIYTRLLRLPFHLLVHFLYLCWRFNTTRPLHKESL